jgi:hypothetical protein
MQWKTFLFLEDSDFLIHNNLFFILFW